MAEPPLPPLAEAVFAKLERLCPQHFRRDDATATLRIPAGALRGYPNSDVRAYVLDDGTVMFKYQRSLNPEVLGSAETVMKDAFTLDCSVVKRREVLPWRRAL